MDYSIHWFRRDLRLKDNHALFKALSSGFSVKCIFIFDTMLLCKLPKQDKRLQFLHDRLYEIKQKLQAYGSDLWVYHGDPIEVWSHLANDTKLKAVFANRDYEPYARERDQKIYEQLKQNGVSFTGYKDQVVFEKQEILSGKGTPYTVYTPYKKAWKKALLQQEEKPLNAFPVQLSKEALCPSDQPVFYSLDDLGFESIDLPSLPLTLDQADVSTYDEVRDSPAKDATTRIGTALRFGTLSVREAVRFAKQQNETFWDELIWREFFMQILYNYPRVATEAFREKYNAIQWRNKPDEFQLWCEGKTGFPLVDAGMRELNATGFMHNRARMVTASFLVKELLIDWRWGEAYFAEKLMDFDLAANNGNWQWAAGTGTDAAPYFRIFNPASQQKRFDAEAKYIKKWVPEYGTSAYSLPMLDRKESRERCLLAYKEVQ